jgi:hypothetical protein
MVNENLEGCFGAYSNGGWSLSAMVVLENSQYGPSTHNLGVG